MISSSFGISKRTSVYGWLISSCLLHISSWIPNYNLKIDISKLNLLSHQNPLLQFSHLSQYDTIFYLLKLENLSVVIDSSLFFISQVRSDSKRFHSIFKIYSEFYQFSPSVLPSLWTRFCHLPTWITAVVSSVLSWFCLYALILAEMLVIVCPFPLGYSSGKFLS